MPEQASPASGPSGLESLLTSLAPLDRSQQLALLRADQRRRWAQGERTPVEEYLRRLGPAWEQDAEAALDLIYSEVLLREEAGERPQEAEYTRRFPCLAEPLARQFAVHRGLAPSAAPGPRLDLPSAGVIPPTVAPGQTAGTGAEATLGLGEPGSDLTERGLYGFLAPAQSADELGRLGPYRVLKVLGHGGMGVVFQAEDPKLRRLVALKAMLPGLAASARAGERFLREAQAMASLKHDHVATIHQVDEDRGVPFLAMEFLQGEPLDARLRRDGKLPLAEALRIGREIAEGLEAAHERGLIHRDVKPANVWLEGKRARVKILDFGLARAATQEAGLTQQGAIIGTPAYMSPEQARGEPAEARSDLFSLGVVLYHMLTGRQPFQGKDAVSTLLAVASEQPQPPARLNPGVPQRLSELVMRLLEKDPARRPASAGEVAEALRALEAEVGGQGDTVRIRPEPPAAGAGRDGRRMALVVALALAGLVPLAWWLATVVLRVETANGTLIVEMSDAETEARIKDGKLVLIGPDDQIRYMLLPSERDTKIEAGPYKVRVEGADGLTLDTPEFTLKTGGKVTVRVTAVPKAVQKAIDPDREAAEWVLSIGGTVGVNGDHEIKAAGELDRGLFRLSGVNLRLNKQVGDAGLAHFKDCKNLRDLQLAGTHVSDAGLAHIKDCKGMRYLDLSGTSVTDAGLAHLKGYKDLWVLYLHSTNVSDAGLTHFEGCKNLGWLILAGTQVSDAGLAYFKDCKNLEWLALDYTNVTDLGLAPFKDCKGLAILSLRKTKVTAAMVEEFRKALPKCKIQWDGGVIEPQASLDPDRRAAEWVLSIGGTVRVNGQDRDFKAAAQLPRGAFRLTSADLVANRKVSDAGLASFEGCKNLTRLNLFGTPVSDAGLVHFKECKDLAVLDLSDTKVGDAGLAPFEGCKSLGWLYLNGTQVSDGGLAHFKDCQNLTNLGLRSRQVSDGGLAYFKDCKKLAGLDCADTKVSDLSPLKGMPLVFLNCSGTKAADLSPLRGTALTRLDCHGTPVSDLTPLKGMKLTDLSCFNTRVSDLSPLQGMPLTILYCQHTRVSDLLPLKGMPLTQLHCAHTKVSDLTPLKGMPLTALSCSGTPVSDLAPLNGMPLTTLDCQRTKVTDLLPLKGMPLADLACDFKPERDAEILRSIKTLEKINGKPAADFWKEVDARKP